MCRRKEQKKGGSAKHNKIDAYDTANYYLRETMRRKIVKKTLFSLAVKSKKEKKKK